ncbi:MAG: hypothetical protein A2X18_12495 [Bacteroidetes bacterium GWF2_40_14]|nr:MAG: hypothetical protein A2X18_12495 [Bacteroidetes bacterium GWF2_40_14]
MDFVKKEDYDCLLKQVEELLEMQKRSQKQTDDLIDMCTDAISLLAHDTDRYRDKRIKNILNYPPLKQLRNDPAIIIHIMPLDINTNIDLTSQYPEQIYYLMEPYSEKQAVYLYNADGFYTYVAETDDTINTYYHIKGNGVFEMRIPVLIDDGKGFVIHEELFLSSLHERIVKALNVQQCFSITPPVNFYVSLINIDETFIYTIHRQLIGPFKIQTLLLPKITIDDIAGLITAIKPALHIMWQACGAKGYNK